MDPLARRAYPVRQVPLQVRQVQLVLQVRRALSLVRLDLLVHKVFQFPVQLVQLVRQVLKVPRVQAQLDLLVHKVQQVQSVVRQVRQVLKVPRVQAQLDPRVQQAREE